MISSKPRPEADFDVKNMNPRCADSAALQFSSERVIFIKLPIFIKRLGINHTVLREGIRICTGERTLASC